MSTNPPKDKFIGKGQYGEIFMKAYVYKNQKIEDTILELAVLTKCYRYNRLNTFVSVDPDSHFIVMKMLQPCTHGHCDAMKLYQHIKLALGLLHTKIGIAHCDVNLRNIMFDPVANLFKLIDFGTSVFLSHFDGEHTHLPITFERNTVPWDLFVQYKDLKLLDFGQLLWIVFESYSTDTFGNYKLFQPSESIPNSLKIEIEPYVKNGIVQIKEMYIGEVASMQHSDPCQVDICEIVKQCPRMVEFVTHLCQLTERVNLIQSDPYKLCLACDWYALLWKYASHKINDEPIDIMVATCIFIAYNTTGFGNMLYSDLEYTHIPQIKIHHSTFEMLFSILYILKDAFPKKCAFKVKYQTKPIDIHEFINFYTQN